MAGMLLCSHSYGSVVVPTLLDLESGCCVHVTASEQYLAVSFVALRLCLFVYRVRILCSYVSRLGVSRRRDDLGMNNHPFWHEQCQVYTLTMENKVQGQAFSALLF